jgi:hypothetical protein
VNGRLPVLLRWLREAQPDIVCLQELKARRRDSPSPIFARPDTAQSAHGQKGWNGVAILSRGTDPVETRRGLPGDPEDLHSRYIEAAVGGLTIGCLYLPNGNPAPGRNSITSSLGSGGSRTMARRSSPPMRPLSWRVITTCRDRDPGRSLWRYAAMQGVAPRQKFRSTG